MESKTNRCHKFALLLAIFAVFASGCGYSALDPGSPMPSLAVEGWMNGSEPDLAGKVVVIEAFATW